MFDSFGLTNKAFFMWTIQLIKEFSTGRLSALDKSKNPQEEDPIHNEDRIFSNCSNSLIISILKAYKFRIAAYLFYSLFNIALRISTVYFMFDLLTYVTEVGEGTRTIDDDGKRLLQIDCSIIVMSTILQGFFDSWIMMLAYRTDFKVKAGLLSRFFKKLLMVSTPEMYPQGKIATIVQVDIENTSKFVSTSCIMMNNFIMLCILGFITIDSLKLGSLVFFGVILLIVLTNIGLGAIQNYFNSEYIKKKDKRVHMIKSIIQCISYVKLKCLEEFYQKKMEFLKMIELKKLRMYYISLASLISCTILIIMFSYQAVILGTVLLVPGISPPSLMRFGMTYYLSSLATSNVINYVAQLFDVFASVKRLEKFFKLQNSPIKQIDERIGHICLSPGQFDWVKLITKEKLLASEVEAQNTPLLENPIFDDSKRFQISLDNELSINTGEFVCVLGPNGSGKSTLLSSIIGETRSNTRERSSTIIGGRISYLPQAPWIFPGTIEDNITFGAELNSSRIIQCLNDSLFLRDVIQMEHRLGTYCEEHGNNLSGGQRARLALARCLYYDADILILDDPLKAIDAKVKRDIINKLSSQEYSRKTRIIATNDPSDTRAADRIILLDQGRVIFDGTPQKAKLEHPEIFRSNCLEKEEEDNLESVTESEKEIFIKDYKDLCREEEDPIETTQKGRVSIKIVCSLITQYGIFSMCVFFIIPFFGFCVCAFISYKNTTDWIYAYSPSALIDYESMFLIMLSSVGGGIIYLISMTGLLLLGIGFAKRLHADMVFGVLHSHVTKYLEQIPSGLLLNRFTNDFDTIERQLSMSALYILNPLYTALVELAYYFLIADNIIFYGIVGFYIFGLIYCQNRYLQANNNILRKINVTKTPLVQLSTGISIGLSQIRTMRKEEYLRKLSTEYINQNVKYYLIRQGLELGFNAYLMMISTLLLIVPSFIYIYNIIIVQKEVIDYASLSLFLQQLTDIPLQLFVALTFYNRFESSLINLERCKEIAVVELEPGYEIGNKGLIEQPTKLVEQQSANNSRVGVRISFKNIEAIYPNRENPVLKNISFEVAPGEKIAIVGRTGCGKSSLIKTLWRALELKSGDIEINGNSIHNMSLHELRKKISVVSQDIMIIDGTLRENMDPLKNVATDEKLIDALIKVGMPIEIVEQYPLKSLLSGNSQLSPGHLQLICMARELLSNKGLLIFDEPTSNFDTNLENRFKQILFEEFKAATVLMISHRLESTFECDKVLVLDDGIALEYDDPKKLLADSNSSFYRLAKKSK